MFNAKEYIEDLVDSGMSRREAVRKARERLSEVRATEAANRRVYRESARRVGPRSLV